MFQSSCINLQLILIFFPRGNLITDAYFFFKKSSEAKWNKFSKKQVSL